MELLRGIRKKAPYEYVPTASATVLAPHSTKGVECILKTQVVLNGKPTVWCAQHDEHTLAPAKARAYELPSLSGQESDEIVILLMSLPNPSQEVINCIENAVEWFSHPRLKA